jgi:DNA-binding transcriptional ArsR family regulator
MRRSVKDGVCEVDCVHPAQVRTAKAFLSPAASLRQAADKFRVLGHPTRLRILEALHGGELCVCDLSQVLDISMPATSQALRDLRELGAVDYRVAGKLAYYHLADRFWLELARTVMDRQGGMASRKYARRNGKALAV